MKGCWLWLFKLGLTGAVGCVLPAGLGWCSSITYKIDSIYHCLVTCYWSLILGLVLQTWLKLLKVPYLINCLSENDKKSNIKSKFNLLRAKLSHKVTYKSFRILTNLNLRTKIENVIKFRNSKDGKYIYNWTNFSIYILRGEKMIFFLN